MCPSIRLKFRNFLHTQQASANIIHQRHNWKGCSQLSVERTPPRLVSVSSSPSPLSPKLCSTCVLRTVKDWVIYRIISRPVTISYTRGIIGRAIVGCPSNSHLQVWCLSAPPHHICLLSLFHVCPSIRSNLEIYSIISRPVPISHTRGILWRAVVGCPSNVHHQIWCLSASLYHLCLLNFVPSVCIDPLNI